MKSYVLGFLFTTDKKHVWLIRKNKPEWQKGKLNGIGGKVEEYKETYLDAMNREFMEEAGISIIEWNGFCNITDDKEYEVACYYAFSDETPKTMTDEIIFRCEVDKLPNDVIFNLHWLIPMALTSENRKYVVIERFKIEEPKEIKIDWAEERRKDIEELGLTICENCNEQAWDGYICHACGAKII